MASPGGGELFNTILGASCSPVVVHTPAGVVKPSTREWFASARNHALYANQGGVYDDVLKYLDKR